MLQIFFFEKNPELKVTAYNAGISGTNSQQGAIRYKRDILSHNPDIVFIEFAVNDCGRDEQNSKEHIESMIRQSLEAEKIPYIILLYAPEPVDKDTDIYESWKKGVNWKEEIANHYGLKSINIYDYMYSDYEMLKEDDEELTFFEYLGELGYKKTSDTTYDVHAGYGKYKEAILKELENNFSECMTKPEKKLAYCTSSVFDWDYIHIPVDSNRLTFKGEWNKYTKENQYSGSYEHSIPGVDYSYPYFPEGIAQTEVANSSFEFETTVGVTGIMLSYISSTAGADASVYVDGTRTGSFSCYSQYHRMNYHSAWISVPNDGKTHLVNVVVDGINDEKTVFRFGSVIERYVK